MHQPNWKKIVVSTISLLLVTSALIFLLATESGLRFIFATAAQISGGKLTAQKLNGSLLGPIEFEKLNWKTKQLNLVIDQCRLEWRAKELFLGRLTITSLEANNLIINTVSVAAKKSQPTLVNLITNLNQLHLPFELRLNNLHLKNIWWRSDQWAPVKFTDLELQLHAKGKNIKFLKGTLNSSSDTMVLQGSLTKNWDISLTLKVSELHNYYQPLAGSLNCTGKVYGKRTAPHMVATMKLKRVEHERFSAKAIQMETEIDLAFKNRSWFKLGFDTLNIDRTTVTFLKDPESKTLKFKQGTIIGSLAQQSLVASGNFIIAQANPLKVELNLPKLPKVIKNFLTLPFAAKITWQTTDLAFIPKFVPYVKNVLGKLNLTYLIEGTLLNPKIVGETKITNASLEIPTLNLKLKNILLNVSGAKNHLNYTGVLHSGDGNLKLAGDLIFTKGRITSNSSLTGTNLLITNTPEYQITASPQLTLKTNNDRLELTGKMFIPKANIQPGYLSSSGLLPSEIVYVRKGKRIDTTQELNLSTHLQLELGDNVAVNAPDLAGKLQGTLQIIDEPQKNTIANGKLIIKDGTYNIYGQQLKITKGNLDYFRSPITNPNVYIEIIRNCKLPGSTNLFNSKENELTVGLRMRGRLENAKVELFSAPPGLTKPDILSYLILGESSEQVTDNTAQLLLQAAAMLNFGGASEVSNWLGKLKKKLGFSEIGIIKKRNSTQPSPTTKTPDSSLTDSFLVLGKFLTPKLYISYTTGLVEPTSIFQIKHFINKYLFLQLESSSLESNLGIFYTIERD